MERPSSSTIATASRWNSGGYFDGRPRGLFLPDTDFLLYEVSAQLGDAQAHVSNGPTEAANNLIKRVKRVAFGFTRWRNYRIRVLLYAGRPNWDLLATIRPR